MDSQLYRISPNDENFRPQETGHRLCQNKTAGEYEEKRDAIEVLDLPPPFEIMEQETKPRHRACDCNINNVWIDMVFVIDTSRAVREYEEKRDAIEVLDLPPPFEIMEQETKPRHRACDCNINNVWIDMVFVIDTSRAVSQQDFIAVRREYEEKRDAIEVLDLPPPFEIMEQETKPRHRACDCNINNVWIDMVFVIDTSRAVSQQDFIAASNLLSYLFEQMTISQGLGQYARVGLIFGAEKAYVAANLTTYENRQQAVQKVKQLMRERRKLPVGNGLQFDVGLALTEAKNILNRDARSNKPAMVILFSATEATCQRYQSRQHGRVMRTQTEDPCRIATRLTEENNVLATVALKFGSLRRFPRLDIATPCFNITNSINLPGDLLQKICDGEKIYYILLKNFIIRPKIIKKSRQHGRVMRTQTEDPCRIATRLTEENNVLATVALKFGSLRRFPRLDIATPCFNITNSINLPGDLLQKICDANCFCLPPYVQYKDDKKCTRYSECVYLHGVALPFQSAAETCSDDEATLVDIFDEDKDRFIKR
uniref:VWFA domain-containing protein n=1 Tax=Ascaris lumbricoides TaxID=6252 RepID=A0A0M3IL83_ASCLU